MRQNAVLGASGFVGVDLVTCGYFLVLVHSLVNSGHFVVFWDISAHALQSIQLRRSRDRPFASSLPIQDHHGIGGAE